MTENLEIPTENCELRTAKRAALGFRVHSGWAALVAVSIEDGFPIPMLRERPHLVSTFTYEFRQPYHTAEKKNLEEAGEFIARVRAEAEGLAARAIQAARSNLQTRGYEVRRCGLLTASAKPLPELARILASHPLIHTADGELFRDAMAQACTHHGLDIILVKERELLGRAGEGLQISTNDLTARLAGLGRMVGPPWTQDEKFAALAACIALIS